MKLKMKEKNFLYLIITAQFILSMILYAIMIPGVIIGGQTLINQNEAYEFGVSLYILIIGMVLYFLVFTFIIALVLFVMKVYRDYQRGLDEL